MQEYLNVFQKSSFFAGMDDKEILSVLTCVDGKLVTPKTGEYIFRAGECISSMGMVLDGNVLVIQENVWGHRNVLAKFQAGDFFAEAYAATPESVLNISVVADTDCTIMLLNMNRLLHLCPTPCSHHSKLIRNLVALLAERLLLFNDKITHICQRSIKEKLLSYLSSEAIRQGSMEFNIRFDRQQLADYLSIERSAMSAELSKLQKAGILSTQRNHFVLHQLNE